MQERDEETSGAILCRMVLKRNTITLGIQNQEILNQIPTLPFATQNPFRVQSWQAHVALYPRAWEVPKNGSTLGLYNLHHKSIGAQNWGIYFLDPRGAPAALGPWLIDFYDTPNIRKRPK